MNILAGQIKCVTRFFSGMMRMKILMILLLKLTHKIFSIYDFCGEAAKKTSIDGLKWRDLVVVVGR